ncbi:MAG: rod shape-determining protein [Anaerolineales bacterium]|nr:MAG: rod shape-determining protein [Anaerolineales bacterium]
MFRPLDALFGLFSLDVGIDLGTANTLVYVGGKGIVINEPSWVAIDKDSSETLAIGAEAKEMVGRTPANIVAIRPLRNGVISEFEITERMLEYFIRKAHSQLLFPFPRPRVIIGIPSGATEVERRAVEDAALSAGARQVYLIEEPRAAAIGAGLPINEIRGSMLIDIGGGTTEVGVFSLGDFVVSRSMRIAGDEMDEGIVQYARQKYNLHIGERMAERVKIAIGSACPQPEESTITLRGRNLVTGLPQAIEVSSIEIREALRGALTSILDLIKSALEETPPELLDDVMVAGICLAGGSSMLRGLAQRVTEETNVPAWVAEDPMTCVARGAGLVLEQLDEYGELLERTLKRNTRPPSL